MIFLAWLALEVFLFVASALLTPKPHIEDATPQDPQGPRSEEGVVIPVIFGTAKVSPNMVWFTAKKATPIEENVKTGIFSSKNVTTGHNYAALMHSVLCHGPIDEVIDIVFSRTISLSGSTTAETYGPIDQDGDGSNESWGPIYAGFVAKTSPAMPYLRSTDLITPYNGVTFQTDEWAKSMLGGYQHGGGVSGRIHVYWGVPIQSSDPTLNRQAAIEAGPIFPVGYESMYEGICHVVMGNIGVDGVTVVPFEYGESPIVPEFEFILRRCPSRLGLSATQTNIGGGANPAEMIYEILTDLVWGLGIPLSHIDIPSFVAAGITLASEDFGMNLSLTTGSQGSETITEILRYIDGQVQQHPVTGLIELSLNRNDYVVSDLQLYSPDNAANCQLTRPSWTTLKNEVRAIYTARQGSPLHDTSIQFEEVPTQPVQDLAAQRNFGEVNAETVSFPAVSDPLLALSLAVRTLRLLSTPLARVRLTVDRDGVDSRVGRPFALSWPDYGITNHVFRVTSVGYGNLQDGKISIDAVEDIFALEQPLYAIPVDDTATTAGIPNRRSIQVNPIPNETPTTGSLTLEISAPVGVVVSVEFQSQSGNRAESAWHTSENNTAFYATVDKHSSLQSRISWRILGYRPDGTIGVLVSGDVSYDIAQYPARPRVSLITGTSANKRTLVVEIDEDTVVLRYLLSTAGYPSALTVRAAPDHIISQPGTTRYTAIDAITLTPGQQAYATVLGYDILGTESYAGVGFDQSVGPTGPALVVMADITSTLYTISYTSDAPVFLSIDGGTFSLAPASPITVSRPASGLHSLDYQFRSSDGINTAYDTISVLPVGVPVPSVVDLNVIPVTTTATVQTYTSSATDSISGALVAVNVICRGCTGVDSVGNNYLNGVERLMPVGATLTVNRPTFGSTAGATVTFRAGVEKIQRTVLAQVKLSFGPSLEVTPKAFATLYTIDYTSNVAVELSIDNGSFSAAPASPISVSRPAAGAQSLNYTFRALLDAQTVTDAITVESIDKDTVAPDLSVVQSAPTLTTVLFTPTVLNPAGGVTPTLTVTLIGCSAVINGVTQPPGLYTIASGTDVTAIRPVFDVTAQASVKFIASISGGGKEEIQRTVLNQVKDQFGPNLIVQVAPGPTVYSITWSGSGVLLSIDAGSFTTPGVSPIPVPRNPFGGGTIEYVFSGTQDGRTVTVAVTIPQQADKGNSKVLTISNQAFHPVRQGQTWQNDSASLKGGTVGTVETFGAYVPLPAGVTITQVDMVSKSGGAGTLSNTLQFFRQNGLSITPSTLLGTATRPSTGPDVGGTNSITGLSELTTGRAYCLLLGIEGSANHEFYAAVIYYTSPAIDTSI